MRCATHPEVETNLSCGKCGEPICPSCLVQTLVGARCRECAQLRRLPTYEVGAPQYLRAVGVGLGLAIVLGIAWGLISWIIPFYLNIILAAGVGFAIGDVVSRSVRRKRAVGLQVIGGSCVVLSYLVSALFSSFFNLFDILALALGIFVAVSYLR